MSLIQCVVQIITRLSIKYVNVWHMITFSPNTMIWHFWGMTSFIVWNSGLVVLQLESFMADIIFIIYNKLARQFYLGQLYQDDVTRSEGFRVMRYCKLPQILQAVKDNSMWLWLICGPSSTDVCPNVDVMEKASPSCPGFSQHAKNTALIDPLSLSLIPSPLLRLSQSPLSCHVLFSPLSTVSLN